MHGMISDIIGAEVEGQKIVDKANEEKKSLVLDLEVTIKTLREKRMGEAKKEISETLSKQAKLLEKKISDEKSVVDKKLAEIDDVYKKNKNEWNELIYNKIIGN